MSAFDDTGGHLESALTAFQIEVANLFFGLPAAAGFLLAGGAALAAQGLTTRPTRDLDLFTAPGRGDVGQARDALEAAARERGWSVTRVRDDGHFVRLIVTGPTESVLIDLAVDAAPELPSRSSPVGPTLDPDELAGRKTLALFGRAEARDFSDVNALLARYEPQTLLTLAARGDPGFDLRVFADMLDSLARFTDRELPIGDTDPTSFRVTFADWARQLREAPSTDDDGSRKP